MIWLNGDEVINLSLKFPHHADQDQTRLLKLHIIWETLSEIEIDIYLDQISISQP